MLQFIIVILIFLQFSKETCFIWLGTKDNTYDQSVFTSAFIKLWISFNCTSPLSYLVSKFLISDLKQTSIFESNFRRRDSKSSFPCASDERGNM